MAPPRRTSRGLTTPGEFTVTRLCHGSPQVETLCDGSPPLTGEYPIYGVGCLLVEVWGSRSPSEALQPPPAYDRKPSREHIGAVIVPISTRLRCARSPPPAPYFLKVYKRPS